MMIQNTIDITTYIDGIPFQGELNLNNGSLTPPRDNIFEALKKDSVVVINFGTEKIKVNNTFDEILTVDLVSLDKFNEEKGFINRYSENSDNIDRETTEKVFNSLSPKLKEEYKNQMNRIDV